MRPTPCAVEIRGAPVHVRRGRGPTDHRVHDRRAVAVAHEKRAIPEEVSHRLEEILAEVREVHDHRGRRRVVDAVAGGLLRQRSFPRMNYRILSC